MTLLTLAAGALIGMCLTLGTVLIGMALRSPEPKATVHHNVVTSHAAERQRAESWN